MKKVLSLVLAFAMILGSFGFVFASEFPDVPDTEYFSEPVNVLSGFGVIAGYPDGTFQPTKVVTRAEMVTMIVAALNIPVKGGATTKRFSDVELSHWAAGFIDYGASVGFVAGYPDGTFQPEKEVSYNEALTMIVAALGYTAEALPGTWPGNFVNKAQSLGILDICRTTGTAGAPRQDIACFLYKALTQPIGYVNKDGTFVTNIGKDGGDDTMLQRLGADLYVDIPKTDADGWFVVDGTEDSDINLQNYLGAYITAYADKDGVIVAVKEVGSEFIEGTYKSDKVDGKTISAAIAGETVPVFYNGDTDSDDTLSNFVKKDVKLAVKLNGKKVSEIYSIQVWEADRTFMAADDVQEEIAEDQKLDGEKFALDDDDEIDMTKFAIAGKTAITDIKEDDVVTIYLHTHATGDLKDTIAKIEVSDKTVEGAVTKISADKSEFTIGGTAYGLNDDNTDGAYELKDEGTFFLDYAGDIFHFEAADDSTSNYAVVLEIGSSPAKYGGDTYYANLLLADGTTKEYELKSDEVLKTFKVTDGDTPSGKVFAKGSTYGELVKYTVNAKEQISKFVDAEARIADPNGEFNKKGVYVAEGAMLKDNAVVFSYTGTIGDPDDLKDADKYEVVTATSMYDADFTGVTPFVNDDGDYVAAIVDGAKAGEEEYAVLVDYTATEDGVTVWTALYEGTYTEEFKIDDDFGTSFTTGAAAYYEVKVADGVASKVTPGSEAIKPADVSDATSVTNGVFKDAAGTNWTLSDDVVIYVCNADGDWSVAKSDSVLAKRAGKLDAVKLIDVDADGEYDIVMVFEK